MGIRSRGQAFLEYAVLIAALVGALLTMQIYMKRGFSGRLRSAADSISQAYAPQHTTGDLTFSTTSKSLTNSKLIRTTVTDPTTNESVGVVAMQTDTQLISEKSSRTGKETVGSLNSEKLWDK